MTDKVRSNNDVADCDLSSDDYKRFMFNYFTLAAWQCILQLSDMIGNDGLILTVVLRRLPFHKSSCISMYIDVTCIATCTFTPCKHIQS